MHFPFTVNFAFTDCLSAIYFYNTDYTTKSTQNATTGALCGAPVRIFLFSDYSTGSVASSVLPVSSVAYFV